MRQEPMVKKVRVGHYLAQTQKPELTPRQRRRVNKKENKLRGNKR